MQQRKLDQIVSRFPVAVIRQLFYSSFNAIKWSQEAQQHQLVTQLFCKRMKLDKIVYSFHPGSLTTDPTAA
jgi:hypothetical protein